MDHPDLFNSFLADVVRLNDTRVELLEGRVETVSTYLQNRDFPFRILDIRPQGSWAHGTIVRPLPGKGFDADLVVYVAHLQGWEAQDYIQQFDDQLSASDRYDDKIVRDGNHRCVTVEYAGDFHIDVVPVVVDQTSGQMFVCNKTTNEFEPTSPDGYTDWFRKRDAVISGALSPIIQLVKYQRNIKRTFSAKSILLTTLLGRSVQDGDAFGIELKSLAELLRLLVGRVDNWLAANPTIPAIQNPAHKSEYFTRHWDDATYQNFRACWSRYRIWIDDAYAETNATRSVEKWRRVFGDEFGAGAPTPPSKPARRRLHSELDRWQAAVASEGSGILKRFPTRLLTYRAPDPPMAGNVGIRVVATIHSSKSAPAVRQVASGDVIEDGWYIRLAPKVVPAMSDEFSVRWRITNTGSQAFGVDEERGGFEAASESKTGVRWEHTSYRGVHLAEAFLYSRRSNTCVGKSEPFFVVVQPAAPRRV